MKDWNMRDQISRVGKCMSGKSGTGKCSTKNAGVEMQDRKMREQFSLRE